MSPREALAALLWISSLLSAPMLPLGMAQALAPQGVGEDCETQCGNVTIHYPFGFGPDHCALPGFHLHCNQTADGIFKPFTNGIVEVLNISLQSAQVQVMNFISSYCKDTASGTMVPETWNWDLVGTSYTFSDPANKFTVIGCQTLAYIGGSTNEVTGYETGCVSFWPNGNYATNGSCSGMGCCQTAIPTGLRYYNVWFDEHFDPSAMNNSCNCSYAVLMDSSNFTFKTSYLTSSEFNDTSDGRVPLLLQWSIGTENCEDARKHQGFACVSDNSNCSDAPSGQGYICNCKKGYKGNPYLTGDDGCKDIDECLHATENGCYGKCTNEPGNFTCICPAGTRGNAFVDGSCQKELLSFGAQLVIGVIVAVVVGLIGFLGIQLIVHKRNSRRQAYFQEHGGQMLSRILRRDGNHGFTFYETRDIVKATSNFRKANIVGQGAHGTVYKAILDVSGSATAVAVKRCKQIDKTKTMEFVQELVILCSVSHPNVVKLLGCCLKFEAPVLVYEFVQNGTLRNLLHGRPWRPLTLATRLKIATDLAVALEHLHSHAILHGDVKPENILLGDRLLAKVSDFGCSTIDDNIQVIPKGTLGYLDPEFLNDSKLTEKSDVYSFGVVLMELLTGKKPLVKGRKNLTLLFQQSLVAGTLGELLDADIEVDEGSMVMIHQAAELASRCIAIPSETRPTMAEVATELQGLSDQVSSRSQPQQEIHGPGYIEMSDEIMTSGYTTAENLSTGFHRLECRAALSTELAR
ncbi:unnamed protein product [Urochloa humidicola]